MTRERAERELLADFGTAPLALVNINCARMRDKRHSPRKAGCVLAVLHMVARPTIVIQTL
jgi:hypothetical protein